MTAKIHGDDCTVEKYLEQPERLCDELAQRLAMLHSTDFEGCPVMNHTERYLAKAAYNYKNDLYDKSHFPDSFGYSSPDKAWSVVETQYHLLRADTLLHGDFCLPNIILNDW